MRPATADDLRLLQASLADPSLVFLDGFHALKHAVRFGAELLLVVVTSSDRLRALAGALAADVLEPLEARACVADRRDVDAHTTVRPHWTGVWGVARRPSYDATQALAATDHGPLVLLEQPKHRGNLGACIRVAAAAGAGGVVVLGGADPWEPAVVRGAAGLHFAIPVVTLQGTDAIDRPIVAFDPDGDELRADLIPNDAVLAFGSERDGLSDELLRSASARLRIPMQPGVSSLNLAVAVGVVLYAVRH
jgi:TrmH family RNA methyltransferase